MKVKILWEESGTNYERRVVKLSKILQNLCKNVQI